MKCLVLLVVTSFLPSAYLDIGLPLINGGSNNDGEQRRTTKNRNREEIRLEDFFWTGSGEGKPPPDIWDNGRRTGISRDQNVIIKTETVVATVYLDGNNDINVPVCLDCTRNNLPLNLTKTDRRYWLLTVFSGFHNYSELELPYIEEQLSKLYRLAFTRQQINHFGIENEKNARSKDNKNMNNNNQIYIDRNKRNHQGVEVEEDLLTPTTPSSADLEDAEYGQEYIRTKREGYFPPTNHHHMPRPSTDKPPHYDLETKTNRMTVKFDPNFDNYMKQQSIFPEGYVKVVIHNVSLLTENDIKNSDYFDDEDVRDKLERRKAVNQTEIIYSVFANDKPVLAVTAAEDMKLVSDIEVETILDKDVIMKAEPYLREPHATPLVPGVVNGHKGGVFVAFEKNPILVAVSSVAFLLLLLLVITLFLMGKKRRKENTEIERIRDEILRENTLVAAQNRSKQLGHQNQAFEHDSLTRTTGRTDPPYIDFPLPPQDTRRPSSSSTNTSDSSIYCPVNVQSHPPPSNQTESSQDPIYSSLMSKNREKKVRYKTKRRENKVGSIKEHETRSSIGNISEIVDGTYRNYEDKTEVFNLQNNYHRNKILQNQVFIDKNYDTVLDEMTPAEAINKQIIRALQPSEGDKTSDETGSIGSFLSMASLRTFPKSRHPEPLCRVLEPVSLTYYDNIDEKSIGRFSSRASDPQSDNADPGVVGPIVWEMHKKKVSARTVETSLSQEESPNRDPLIVRNRFEGLLEGAMQMYTGKEDIPTELPSKFEYKRKESRGKSASVAFESQRKTTDCRPKTAQPKKSTNKVHAPSPPSPNNRAWASGTQSPLVRPLSAGPFHRPEATNDSYRKYTQNDTLMSAAPLIADIQNELKKMKRDNYKLD